LAAVASIPPRYSVLGSAGLSTATTPPLWRALLWTRPPPNSSSARISSSVPRAGASALLLPGLPSAPTKCLSLLLQQQHNDNQREMWGWQSQECDLQKDLLTEDAADPSSCLWSEANQNASDAWTMFD
ncbi:Os09g0309900, partial [Oryza sativa Japonica Group]